MTVYTTSQAALSKALGFAQMAALAVIFFGDKILPALGIHQPPDIYRKIVENKFGWAMGVWFVGNMLHNGLTSTGAFEIYYDGHLVRCFRRVLLMPASTVGSLLVSRFYRAPSVFSACNSHFCRQTTCRRADRNHNAAERIVSPCGCAARP